MKRQHQGKITALIIISIVALIGLVSTMDFQDEVQQHDYYCDMVTLWQLSDGESGWPDFRENYDEVCE